MAKGKKSNGSQYKGFDGGKVADTVKNTVYSPNQVKQMYAESQRNLSKSKK